MYAVSKTYRFEAAHRLTAPYKGKCNSLHGHSFEVRLTLARERLNACDMVEDFAAFKPIQEWIMTHLDHATLVSAKDHELLRWLNAENQKHFITEGNPTSEVLAKAIFDQATHLGFELSEVSLAEACSASARFTRPD